jgi:hypothetical protein
LLFANHKLLKRKERVSSRRKRQPVVTEKYTPEAALRIRIKSLPIPGEFDEFDLQPYRVGLTYELPMRLASLLILGGYAEQAGAPMRAEAADFGQIRFTPKKR